MVKFSTNNQYISYEEFKKFSQYFLEKSNQFKYHWEWVEVSNKRQNGFLKLIQLQKINKEKINLIEPPNENDIILNNIISKHELYEIENQCIDNDVINEDSNNIEIMWEWHIVYSHIFQVPVLFFNAWDQEQKPIDVLSNKDIFPIKPLNTPIITQKDHPILGIPYYYVHPCETGQSMNNLYDINKENDLNNLIEEIDDFENEKKTFEDNKEASEKYKNYIASWLSTIGFIKVDIKYFM